MFKRHSTTRLNRVCVPLLLLVGAVALLAIPSGATAATQIGETFTPTTTCLDNQTLLQSTSPGGQYLTPSAGVITRWSFQAPAANVPLLKFKVGRSAGGNDFTIIGESAQVTPVVSTLNSYFTRVPVQGGDIIGFYDTGAGTRLCGTNPVAGYAIHAIFGDVAPPTTAAFTPQAGPKLDVSAFLEADCDKDGLGDETQDGSLVGCGPGGTTIAPMTCRGQRVNIVGTSGADEIVGTPGPDVIAGLAGNDRVFAFGGNDLVCGNNGADRIRGGPGNDILKGNHGNDTLRGKRGNDILRGGKQNDTCFGGKGDDTFRSC
jgi:Ca2+-binding RTX toxin-like protein